MALVIGIDNYKSLPKLEKAVGDAEALSSTLAGLGFEVTKVINADRQKLNIRISEFASKLGRDDLAFVHFSGHGVEIDGDNFLLPSDVPKPKNGQKGAVKYEGISLRRLIAQITETGVRTRVFVLDACRDNPFEQSGVRSIGGTRGLSRIEAPAGTFIMYSAGYRQVALDKLGPGDTEPTSVYTRVLLNKLNTPGKSMSLIAREVRNEVQALAKTVGHSQRPAYYDELSSGLVLKAAPAPPAAKTSLQVPVNDQLAVEIAYWNSIKDSSEADLLRSYVQKYPEGKFLAIAKIRLSKLTKTAAAANQQKLASLEPSAEPIAESESKPAQPAKSELSQRELNLRAQQELVRLGCNPGRPDGAWGRRSQRALKKFARSTKARLSIKSPTRDVLETLTASAAPACPAECGRGHIAKAGKCVKRACPGTKVRDAGGRCVAAARSKDQKRTAAKPKQSSKEKRARKASKNAKTRKALPAGVRISNRSKSRRKAGLPCGLCKTNTGRKFVSCSRWVRNQIRRGWCKPI